MNENDLEKAKRLLAGGVTVNCDKLNEAADFLRKCIFAGNQDVDFADAQMMEAFYLMQIIHHLLAVTSKSSGKAVSQKTIAVMDQNAHEG